VISLLVFAKYSENDQVKESEMVRACSTYGDKNAYGVLMGKLEGNRPLGRPKRRWRIMLKWIEEECDGVVWTGLIWLRIRISSGLL
jgi:hypothetical protein